jgi:hypothetical protein
MVNPRCGAKTISILTSQRMEGAQRFHPHYPLAERL